MSFSFEAKNELCRLPVSELESVMEAGLTQWS